MFFEILKVLAITVFGGVSLLLCAVGIAIMRTPTHVWEKRRQEIRYEKNSELYHKDRLWEEIERIEFDARNRR